MLTARQRIVASAINDLLTLSLAGIPSYDRDSIEKAFRTWTSSSDFISLYAKALLNGSFDHRLALESFRRVVQSGPSLCSLSVGECLIPHFLRHLEGNRIQKDRKYAAYRQLAHGFCTNEQGSAGTFLTPITVLDQANFPVVAGKWQSWYSEVHLLSRLAANGRIVHAFEQFRKLSRRPEFSDAPPVLQLAILRSLGELSIQLDCITDSSGYLKAALLVQPADVASLIFLAQVYAHLGEYDAAQKTARDARDHDPTNPMAIATYLLVLGLSGAYQEVFDEVASHPGWLQLGPVVVALGHVMAVDQDYEMAIDFYSRALQLEPEELGILFPLSSCRLLVLQRQQTRTITVTTDKHSELKRAVNEIVADLERLLEAKRASDHPQSMDKYVHALIAAYQLVDDYESALSAINTWASDAGSRAFQLASVLVYLNIGDLERAACIVDQYQDAVGMDIDTCRLCLAQAREDYEQYLEVMERLQSYERSGLRTRILHLSKRARILERLGRKKEAVDSLDKLIADYRNEELALAEAVPVYILLEEEEKAADLIKNYDISLDALNWIYRECAEVYASMSKWLRAATELKKLPNIYSDEEALERLVRFQLNANLNHAAACNAGKLRILRGEVRDDGMATLELRGYQHRGDWDAAIELLHLLQQKYPGNVSFVAHEAWILHKGLKASEQAKRLLKSVDASKLADEERIVLVRNGLLTTDLAQGMNNVH
jgi:tetratricopeptide (TPR) repeat protein